MQTKRDAEGGGTGLRSPPGIAGSRMEKQNLGAKLSHCVASSSQNCLMLFFMYQENTQRFLKCALFNSTCSFFQLPKVVWCFPSTREGLFQARWGIEKSCKAWPPLDGDWENNISCLQALTVCHALCHFLFGLIELFWEGGTVITACCRWKPEA